LLVFTIAVLVSCLQAYALSLNGLRRQVDPHWWIRGMSFVRLCLGSMQQNVSKAGSALLSRMPIPTRKLEPSIPNRGIQRRQKQPWFTGIYLPPRSRTLQQQRLIVA
jgi:hypothetical protein